MKLRVYTEKDAEGAKELIFSILAKEYPFDKSAYSDSDLERIGEVYSGERDAFFVIEENGAIIGTAGIKEDTLNAALLRRLFVESGYRKRGFGTQLLNKAIEFCAAKGYKQVIFSCTGRMLDAMHLCKKAGFNETEQLEVSGFKIHRLVLTL